MRGRGLVQGISHPGTTGMVRMAYLTLSSSVRWASPLFLGMRLGWVLLFSTGPRAQPCTQDRGGRVLQLTFNFYPRGVAPG